MLGEVIGSQNNLLKTSKLGAHISDDYKYFGHYELFGAIYESVISKREVI